MREFVKNPHYLDASVDTFLIFAIMYAFYHPGNVMGTSDLLSLFVFSAEVILKVLVLGFWKYWSSGKHRFDFSVTVMTIVAAAWVLSGHGKQSPEVILTVSCIRTCRLINLLGSVPGFQPLVQSFTLALPQTAPISVVVLCSFYAFGVLGVQLFGGVINKDPQGKYYKLIKDTRFGQSNFYANSCNDLPSAMVLLFELLVINNWDALVEGYSAACGRFVWVYFVSFFLIGNIICLNIMTAVFIDTVVSSSDTSVAKGSLLMMCKAKLEHTQANFTMKFKSVKSAITGGLSPR